MPVYMTEACEREAHRVLGRGGLGGVKIRPFEPGEVFEVADLEFLPVSTSHDAAGPVGFRISDGASVLGFATDLGVASRSVRHTLEGAHLLYLESNHDEGLLRNGPYPRILKQRIRSHRGHLSNEACGALLTEIAHPGLRAVVLGHLSEVNNEPRLAYANARRALAALGAHEEVTLLVARQDRPGRRLKV